MARLSKSFGHASRGLGHALKRELNIKLQIIIAIFVLLFGAYVKLSTLEWVAIIFLILLVLILEILNTIVEHFIDIVVPRFSTQVQVIKDMLAAMVLLASVGAVIIGLIIFWPYLIEIWQTKW